ncbi:MAG: RNA methyltransferase [Flavobacteriaceae bacterium]|nr:RNA methyltransferase [Flavobacteriaceae bacterium]
MELSSLKNPQIKELIGLQQKSRLRKQQHAFVLEGVREFNFALDSGYQVKTLFYCSAITDKSDAAKALLERLKLYPEIHRYELSPEVYAKCSYRSGTEGVIGVLVQKCHQLSELKLPKNPLILIAEAIEKPGNLGALLRTADAAGVDAFIICDPKADVYNPNMIRSSVGTLFCVPTAVTDLESLKSLLEKQKIRSFGGSLQTDNHYTDFDYTEPTAIIVGTEATGISQELNEVLTHKVKIPMRGKIDSMNVSVSAAVLIFEAVRQRSLTN